MTVEILFLLINPKSSEFTDPNHKPGIISSAGFDMALSNNLFILFVVKNEKQKRLNVQPI